MIGKLQVSTKLGLTFRKRDPFSIFEKSGMTEHEDVWT